MRPKYTSDRTLKKMPRCGHCASFMHVKDPYLLVGHLLTMLRTAHPGSSELGHEFGSVCRRKKNRERFMQGSSRHSLPPSIDSSNQSISQQPSTSKKPKPQPGASTHQMRHNRFIAKSRVRRGPDKLLSRAIFEIGGVVAGCRRG